MSPSDHDTKKGSLCIFAKTPKRGEVKTRLEPDLGKDGCLNLHKWLVEDRLRQFSGMHQASYDVELYVTGELQDEYWANLYSSLSLAESVSISLQSGATLGDRMWHAVQKTLIKKNWVILIGADCPDLDTEYVDMAVSAIEEGKEAVIGPADDGGYVLLGLTQPVREVFQGIDWGSDRVLEQSLDVLERLGLNCIQLPVLKDLDVMDDYLYYKSKINA